MSNDELAQIRALTESVLEQARNDESYLAQLRNDPVATLQAAGIPEDAATYIGLEELQPEVVGFKPKECSISCDRWSCSVTICSNVPYTGNRSGN